MVKASTKRAADPGFDSCLCLGNFSQPSHTRDLKIGTPVATLPRTWWYRVSMWLVFPGVSILWLGEMESLICNFYLSVTACTIVWADLSLRYTSMLLGRSATNKPASHSHIEEIGTQSAADWTPFFTETVKRQNKASISLCNTFLTFRSSHLHRLS